jgi:serine/threonine protein kinase
MDRPTMKERLYEDSSRSFSGPRSGSDFPDLEPILGERYELIRPIGEGGFSWVFLARHLQIPSLKVAIKVLKSTHAFDGASMRRLLREAEASAMLESRHCVKVMDIGTSERGYPFLALELVRGVPLRHVLDVQGRLEDLTVARLSRDILLALIEAHEKGLIHRDLKPSNIFVTQEKNDEVASARVIDFGIAQVITPPDSSRDEQTITVEGALSCTPAYAAPEMLRGIAEPASDLYSLGLIMAEMIEGEAPYGSVSSYVVASRQLEENPVPLSQRVQQSRLHAIVKRACSKRMSNRYLTSEEMLRDLRAIIADLEANMAMDSLDVRELVTRYTRRLDTIDDFAPPSRDSGWSGWSGNQARAGGSARAIHSHAPRTSNPSGIFDNSIRSEHVTMPHIPKQDKPPERWKWMLPLALLASAALGALIFILITNPFDDGTEEVAKTSSQSTKPAAAPSEPTSSSRQVVSEDILEDARWTSDREWILQDTIFVRNDAQLTIDAGTTVRGESGAALIITPGSMLYSQGRSDAPVLFTSARPPAERERGDWGGLVLLGRAPTNAGQAHIEGIDARDMRGQYGGEQADGTCGVVEHTIVEYAGFEAWANNELNGVTLGGCGSNTVIRHLTVAHTLDDGVELFGGTTNLEHIAIIDPGDDGLDWDEGWQGMLQHLVVIMGEESDNAIEADNDKSEPDASPRSHPVIRNASLIGPADPDSGQRAMTLRRGTALTMSNSAVIGFPFDPIDIRGAETVATIESGESSFDKVLLFSGRGDLKTTFPEETGQADDDNGFVEAEYFTAATLGIPLDMNPSMLGQQPTEDARDALILGNSGLRQYESRLPEHEFWNRKAQYIGAFEPGVDKLWFPPQ